MEKLQTIVIDIKHSVFENKTVAIIYVTKVIYSESFIVSIPVITFHGKSKARETLMTK